jgi:hypothetical protein
MDYAKRAVSLVSVLDSLAQPGEAPDGDATAGSGRP